jgi:hypothetical protein
LARWPRAFVSNSWVASFFGLDSHARLGSAAALMRPARRFLLYAIAERHCGDPRRVSPGIVARARSGGGPPRTRTHRGRR